MLCLHGGPSVAAGSEVVQAVNELTTLVGASAGQDVDTCSGTAALSRNFLLLISQEECDETRT